eukprot:756818-Ditylum_brightwellii.AAC.1
MALLPSTSTGTFFRTTGTLCVNSGGYINPEDNTCKQGGGGHMGQGNYCRPCHGNAIIVSKTADKISKMETWKSSIKCKAFYK